MLIQVESAILIGIKAVPVKVEVDVSRGARYAMVGLPDSSVRESWQRIESAIQAAGFRMPRLRITVNLAPADLRKSGANLDLPIAVGILIASGQLQKDAFDRHMVVGELGLNGSLRGIKGAICYAIRSRETGLNGLILPSGNAEEASQINIPEQPTSIVGLSHLSELRKLPPPYRVRPKPSTVQKRSGDSLEQIVGNQFAKRALEIAAAGFHHMLLIGPPGTGKSMLAERIRGIMPEMTLDEAVLTTQIYSAAGLLGAGVSLLAERPFRSPHHSASRIALIGGGAGKPIAGEVTLAHNGVLFLDELPEFSTGVLDQLRQPLENGMVDLAKSNYRVRLPSRFLLIAAMNPCPCGNYGTPEKACTCRPHSVARYQARISGPLLDRIDMIVPLNRSESNLLIDFESQGKIESSTVVLRRVTGAHKKQGIRFSRSKINWNSEMQLSHFNATCEMDKDASEILHRVVNKFNLSNRAVIKVLRLAKTICDLKSSSAQEVITAAEIVEALQFKGQGLPK